ncbi:uncharacterized protein [Lolium perenne]|uniref:uncharacterized protein n=1 Tax=Lolium perenne TaxID=4522 RepID=UPI0021F69B2C|nr:uncharacterized protein LOC127315907 [Lolium perenne]
MVEKWIRHVKRDFLDAATTKCVGLDCEFTDPRKKKTGEEQRAAVLQLSVESETLVFQMIHADIKVPQVLKDFLEDGNIRFCGAAIGNDVKKLRLEGIHITSAYDLQKKKKYNHKKKMEVAAQEKEEELIFGWANYPLSYEQVHMQQ